MSGAWCALVLVFGLACAAPARAQSTSPLIAFETELPQLRLMAPLQAWQSLQHPPAAWLADAQYHYWRGVFALGAGQLPDARDSFERALMIDPDHAGAMYDYGLTLCRLGERQSCQTVLQAARRQFGLPPALAVARDSILLVEARLGGGRSSNLNRAPASDLLTVQLDGASIDLQLGSDLRPRPGSFAETGVDLRYVRLESGLKFGASVLERVSSSHDRLGLLATELRQPVATGHEIGLQAYSLSEGGQRGLQAGGAVWEWQPGGAWKKLVLTGERRRLTETNARYTAWRLESQHQPWPAWNLNAFAETEGRTAARAGEGTQRVGGTLQHEVGNTPAGPLEATLRASYGRDAAAYSPLFGDVRRTLRQAELTLRLTTPLEGRTVFDRLGGPRLRTELRSFTQRSNISLFDINEWQLQFSLVWNFQK